MPMRARWRIAALLLTIALPGLCLPNPVHAAEPRTAVTKNDARERFRGTAEENAAISRLSVQYLSRLKQSRIKARMLKSDREAA